MRELVFATYNTHKADEIRGMCGPDLRILTLSDIGFCDEIPELEPDLSGNSLAKARVVSAFTNLPVFSDDTGLEVQALSGAPGVRSSRFAGEHATDEENISKLLSMLRDELDRTARFRTVVTLIWNGAVKQFEGTVQGQILSELRGISGFGYDPVFMPDGYEFSFAEMGSEEKNAISHRYRAFRQLMDWLERKG